MSKWCIQSNYLLLSQVTYVIVTTCHPLAFLYIKSGTNKIHLVRSGSYQGRKLLYCSWSYRSRRRSINDEIKIFLYRSWSDFLQLLTDNIHICILIKCSKKGVSWYTSNLYRLLSRYISTFYFTLVKVFRQARSLTLSRDK